MPFLFFSFYSYLLCTNPTLITASQRVGTSKQCTCVFQLKSHDKAPSKDKTSISPGSSIYCTREYFRILCPPGAVSVLLFRDSRDYKTPHLLWIICGQFLNFDCCEWGRQGELFLFSYDLDALGERGYAQRQ